MHFLKNQAIIVKKKIQVALKMLILKTILVTKYIIFLSIMYNEIKITKALLLQKLVSSTVESSLALPLPVLLGLSPGENF